MENDVRRVSMKMRMLSFIIGAILSTSLIFCSSKDPEITGGGTSWTGTINGSPAPISITSQSARLQGDGGPLLTLAGTSGGKDIAITIDITGGTEVVIPDGGEGTLQAGTSAVNINMDFDSIRYRATSGNVVFTTYSLEEGGNIVGSVDVGLVPTSGTSTGTTALSGAFSATVDSSPTATPTP
jgi:hypothetical protein